MVSRDPSTPVPARLRHAGGTLPWRTRRLLLRPPEPDDAPTVVALAGLWSVARFTASIPYPLTEADVRDWFASAEAHHAEGNGVVVLITRLTDDGTGGPIIGAIDLRWGKTWPLAEVGYWIGEPFQGHGYASEALQAMLQLAFGPLALEAVFATACPDNAASLRVLHKAGLRPDGHRLRFLAQARGTVWEHDRQILGRDTWIAQTTAGAPSSSPSSCPERA